MKINPILAEPRTPVLEIFDYFVSSLYPETCPAMRRSGHLSHGWQDTRAESTGLRLDAGNVVCRQAAGS